MARPKKIIDYELLEKLATIQCTDVEIAEVLGISTSYIDKEKKKPNSQFLRVYKRGKETGKSSLRRAQWKKAITDGNTTMQIWLGKQLLNQTDKHDINQSGSIDIKVQIVDNEETET